MNKHFEDAQYYLKRAGKTAKKGVSEELDPVRERFQGIVVGDEEPEPGRLDQVREDLKEIQSRAEGEAKEAIGTARERIGEYRSEKASSE